MDSRSSWPLNISNSHASSYARLSAPSLLASHQLAAAAGAITKCSSADTMIRRMSVPFASGRLVGVLGGLWIESWIQPLKRDAGQSMDGWAMPHGDDALTDPIGKRLFGERPLASN
jgi:hypothetical protein